MAYLLSKTSSCTFTYIIKLIVKTITLCHYACTNYTARAYFFSSQDYCSYAGLTAAACWPYSI